MHYKVGGFMIDRSQMLKGTLEGCIVKIISQQETYGYEIVTKLKEYGLHDAREGTIYPLLVRLEKKKWIAAIYKASPLGPKRKYYYLTDEGKLFLDAFNRLWSEIRTTVDTIMGG